MPKIESIKKVLVIGSGPIVIGQAAEFDYAGTQACRSLKEEGIEVVLVNSNPATIMTDKDIADEVYIEPLTVEALKQIILKEKPDSILPTLGGQAGLNLAMEIAETGFLEEHNVKLIGTTALTIKKAEDRLMFKETMEKIGEPCAPSLVVNNVEDGEAFAAKIGYPVVLHHIHKSVKQVRCILWTCAGFWMELYCEYILSNILKSLISLIINIFKCRYCNLAV